MAQSDIKKIGIPVAAIFFLVIIGFYFLDFKNRAKEEKEVSVVVSEEGITPPVVEEKIAPPVAQQEKTSLAKKLPPYQGEPVRLLNADPKTVVSVGAELVEKYQKELAEKAEHLAKNPDDYAGWLGVAYIKKLFSNYIGTRDAWEYAKMVNSKDPLAYFNLGELYAYELRDPVKAEENYTAALTMNPHHLDYYMGLADFYRNVLKNNKKAERMLLSALEGVPQTDPNLFASIGAFYRDEKQYTKAIEYFEKALGIIKDDGGKKAIQDELDYIRQKQ